MNIRYLLILLTSLILACKSQAQDVDKELQNLADKLAGAIKEHGNKKVTVIDFTDLQGGTEGELGKYIAEQLTIDLVMSKRDFSVLDRANLRKILAEHKLTATGLVDPENAKKFGMFAGVDAIILGTIIPKGQNINLTAKIITTETAEIVGAARAEFKVDETVQQLVAKPSIEGRSGAGSITDGPGVTKTFGDLRVELQSLRIVNGRQLLLTTTLANQNPKKSLWIALSSDNGGNANSTITDSNGSQFNCESQSTSGIEYTSMQQGQFYHATEIKPNDSISATIKFVSRAGATPAAGDCNVQLELLVGKTFNGNYGTCTVQNITAKMVTN